MITQELVSLIAKDSKLSESDVNKVLALFYSTVLFALKKGDTVTIKEFGRFRLTAISARTMLNVVSGQYVNLPARKVIRFTATKKVTAKVN